MWCLDSVSLTVCTYFVSEKKIFVIIFLTKKKFFLKKKKKERKHKKEKRNQSKFLKVKSYTHSILKIDLINLVDFKVSSHVVIHVSSSKREIIFWFLAAIIFFSSSRNFERKIR